MLGEHASRNVQENSGQDSIVSSYFEPPLLLSKHTAVMGKMYLEKLKTTLLSKKQGEDNIGSNTEEKYKMISRTEAVACWPQGVEAGGGGVCAPWGNENEDKPRQGKKSEPGSPLETRFPLGPSLYVSFTPREIERGKYSLQPMPGPVTITNITPAQDLKNQ